MLKGCALSIFLLCGILCPYWGKLLGVPYYIQDCTKITASGYVGSDVEDIHFIQKAAH